MSYALTQTVIDLPGIPLAEKAVLVVLARHANNDGANDRCPSVKTIAEKAGMSDKGTRNSLRALEKRGLIRAVGNKVGGRALATRYLIVLSPDTRNDVPPFEETRQDVPPLQTRNDVPPKPKKAERRTKKAERRSAEEIQKRSSKEESERAAARADPRQMSLIDEDEQRFQEFYAAYPRHVAPDTARRAYRAALKKPGVTHAVLMEGVARYCRECRGQEPRYVKHPATWLNGGCWADEPATTNTEGKSHGTGSHHHRNRRDNGITAVVKSDGPDLLADPDNHPDDRGGSLLRGVWDVAFAL